MVFNAIICFVDATIGNIFRLITRSMFLRLACSYRMTLKVFDRLQKDACESSTGCGSKFLFAFETM